MIFERCVCVNSCLSGVNLWRKAKNTHRLEGQLEPNKVNFRYVVALLLIRRKRFRFEQTVTEAGEEKMMLTAVKGGEKYIVTNPRLTDEAMTQVQEEVFNVLGWN